MKYIKTFESIDRMPKECSGEDAVKKMKNYERETLSDAELSSISSIIDGQTNFFRDSSILIKNTNHNIIINKLQDDWFVIVIDYVGIIKQAKYYIADEFSELQNFLLAYKNNKITL